MASAPVPKTPAPKLPQFGPRVGKYQLLTPIASGGMATLYLARVAEGPGLGRLLVIKAIHPEHFDKPSYQNHFQSEIETMLGLNHPNIINLYDVGEQDGQPYLALEWIEGRSAKQLLQDEPLPVDIALWIAYECCQGLAYSHRFENKMLGKVTPIIHRDVSPSNILISTEGGVKIIDFGIAKVLTETITEGARGIMGKAKYLSPEQCRGERLDTRTDLFSLGAVLWELLTGQKLFEGENAGTTIWKITNPDFRIPAVSGRTQVPAGVDELLARVLERDREKRTASAEEFGAALKNILASNFPLTDRQVLAKFLESRFGNALAADRAKVRKLLEAPVPAPPAPRKISLALSPAPAPVPTPPLASPGPKLEVDEATETASSASTEITVPADTPAVILDRPAPKKKSGLRLKSSAEFSEPEKRRYNFRLGLALLVLLSCFFFYYNPRLATAVVDGKVTRAMLSRYCATPAGDQLSLEDFLVCFTGRRYR